MPFTFAQRWNLSHGLTLNSGQSTHEDGYLFLHRLHSAFKKTAVDIMEKQLTISTAILVPFALTEASLVEWANRVGRGHLADQMVDLVLDRNGFAANPDDTVDADMVPIVRRAVGVYTQWIRDGKV